MQILSNHCIDGNKGNWLCIVKSFLTEQVKILRDGFNAFKLKSFPLNYDGCKRRLKTAWLTRDGGYRAPGSVSRRPVFGGGGATRIIFLRSRNRQKFGESEANPAMILNLAKSGFFGIYSFLKIFL